MLLWLVFGVLAHRLVSTCALRVLLPLTTMPPDAEDNSEENYGSEDEEGAHPEHALIEYRVIHQRPRKRRRFLR